MTSWTVAHQAPPSMGFSRQEYWSRLPFPPPRDLPNPGIKLRSPALQADALTPEPPGKPIFMNIDVDIAIAIYPKSPWASKKSPSYFSIFQASDYIVVFTWIPIKGIADLLHST